MSHPLEMLQRLEKQLVSFRVSREDAHLVDTLQRIEKEYSSICVIEDKYLSLLYCFLDTLQQAEEKRGSLHMFSDYNHLIETFKEQYGTVLDSDEYWNSEEHDIESILKQVAEKSRSFLPLLEGYHFPKKSRPIDILQRIEEDWGSFSVFSDEYLSKLSHLRQTLQWIGHECTSFNMFLNEYQILDESESDFLHSMQHIVEDWGSFLMYSDEYRSKISNFLEIPRRIGEECQSFLIFFEKYLFSEESDPLETWQWIEKEWGLSSLPTEKYLSSLDGLKFLKRDFKFLDIILNLHVCECGTDAINKVQRLFQGGAADLVQIYSGKVRPWSHYIHYYVSGLQREFWNTKTVIRRAAPYFCEGSFRLLANKDGIVILNYVMEYIETVADNLSDLLKLNDPNSPLMGQIEKALKELKFLNRFVCFVSDRCIEPQPIEPSICEIYIDVLQALKLVQSQWYPVIQMKYVVDCEVGFVETLLHNLEKLPISNNCKETKAILQEMCNYLRINLINLPIQVTELHLRDIDSVIVDVGVLVYSLTDSEKDDHDFPGKIQSVQAVIYIIIRKIFLFQLNLPGIDGVGSAKFILDNREMKKAEQENFLESIKGDKCFDPSHVFPPKYRTPRRLSLHSQCKNLEKWCLSFSHVKSFQFREDRNIAVSLIDRASYMFKRFKFLRVLDLEFTIIDFLPQELTLLRYLAFRTAKDTLSLPADLWNLETLIVQGLGGRVAVPDTIWEMVKLRHLHIYDQAFFTLNKGEGFSESSSKMDDLQTISSVCFSSVENADKILEKTPNLWKLRCEVSKFDGSFPAFSKLKKLEMLKISSGSTLTWINKLKFPSYLKKLTLSNFRINLNEVAALSNLEVLKLLGVTISSNTWKVNDEQFSNLKFLKLENPSFSEWDVSDDAFPCLEHLVLKRCRYLQEIPSCFGYMPSLKSIEVKSCKESLAESAIVIKEMQVEEMAYSGFEVFIHK
ncbi:hypothetical protein HAX54_033326 [Datura stramonium]|uniref:Uncharacterized protein n=1 Tax=Datura stramonium TaxID=4076 RepID=A0ABS8SDC3_DATST|nr:hypothetical protein [Datura stramonium]